MPAFYTDITVVRVTVPDPYTLTQRLRNQIGEPSIGVTNINLPTIKLKKTTALDWTAGEITQATTICENAPVSSPRTEANRIIDTLPVADQAISLVLLDEINTLRALHGLAAITPTQFFANCKVKIVSLTP